MDRRQRKSREAIFCAFTELLERHPIHQITVEQIIQRADVGRATFYAHFETKDTLLKELNRELFCHIFDEIDGNSHRHIFTCDTASSPFLHLFQHLQNNDHQILRLLSCPNNELFREAFQTELMGLIRRKYTMFSKGKAEELPDELWIRHVSVTFVEMVNWWLSGGKKETPEQIYRYFLLVLHVIDEMDSPANDDNRIYF